MRATTTAVLLAGGAGVRLGRGPKALLPFRGRPLIEHQVRVLLAGGCGTVVVVLGAGSAEVRTAARLGNADVVVNPRWDLGMGSSYRCGVEAALGHDPGAVLVALVDQPGLNPAVVARVLAAGRPGRIAAAGYRGADGRLERGHPVWFDASLIPETLAPQTLALQTLALQTLIPETLAPQTLVPETVAPQAPETPPDVAGASAAGAARKNADSDSGARAFLAAHPYLVDVVDCSDLADGRDIDTEADLILLD
ncbi:NTP transferase domain-containing protein [Arthrobacter yangruifuii]|uniref:NTP transferase domain-containing protein n=1 Tax=Arthrobacter yangruifuii TaxID=2606616 RepID=A0A5N6MVV6_9MICC|nr:nucleotidyltransferase family protein [Arthrobacter yangruifuii]KAD4060248.1 NTP transferase domain-containing protein [Arthrobacter yangruifuii]